MITESLLYPTSRVTSPLTTSRQPTPASTGRRLETDSVFCILRLRFRLTVSHVRFTGLVLLTLFLQDMLSLALPCILIIFLKVVSFSKFPMHC